MHIVTVFPAHLIDDDEAATGLPGPRIEPETALVHQLRVTAFKVGDVQIEVAAVALRGGVQNPSTLRREHAEAPEGVAGRQDFLLSRAICRQEVIAHALVAVRIAADQQMPAIRCPARGADTAAEGELSRPAPSRINQP